MMKNAPESTTRRDVKAELLPGVTSEHEASKLLENTAWESCSSKCANILVWRSCSISQSAHPEEKIHSKRKNKARGSQVTSHVVFIFAHRTIHARFKSKCTARHCPLLFAACCSGGEDFMQIIFCSSHTNLIDVIVVFVISSRLRLLAG